MNKLFSRISLFAAILALAACGNKSNDILSTIPADAEIIVRVDAEKFLESAGCTIDDGQWTPGAGVERMRDALTSGMRDDIDNLLAAMPAVDAQNIYFHTYKSRACVTVGVKHPGIMADALEKEFGKPETKDGFQSYGHGILLRDDMLWITNDSHALAESLDAAKKSSASSDKIFDKAFGSRSDDALTVVCNYATLLRANPYVAYSGVIGMMSDKYIAYGMKFKGNSAIIDGGVYSADGEVFKAGGLVASVDDTFTKLLPANTLLAFAFGRPDEEITNQIIDQMGARVKSEVKPFVDALDGTFALAVAPPADFSNLLNLSEWTFTMAVQYKKDKADEIIAFAESFKDQGANVSELSDQVLISVPGGIGYLNPANFYLGYFNGMLVASTRRISADNDNDFKRYFNGYYSAAFLDMPADGDIVKGLHLPFGLKSTMKCDDENYVSEITLDGSKSPFIESIINAATDRAMQREVAEALSKL